MNTPARCVAIGIYDNTGALRRTIDIREDGTFDPFEVAANEMVYSILDLGDGSPPSIAPWQTRHRPVLIENRWAAFTDDELALIRGDRAPEMNDPAHRQLVAELAAELERRRETHTVQS